MNWKVKKSSDKCWEKDTEQTNTKMSWWDFSEIKYIWSIASWSDPNTWLSLSEPCWSDEKTNVDKQSCQYNENILLQGERVDWNIIIVAFNWIHAIHRSPDSVFSIFCNYHNCPVKLGTVIFILQMGNLKLWFAQGLSLSR